MFELMQKLVAFKYSCKLNHWTTTSYSQHLLFDRLQEDIDELVDSIGEMYFMGLNKKAELSNNLLNPAAISSLSCSVSYLFWDNILSLFIFPLSAATILSVSSSFIVLFNLF